MIFKSYSATSEKFFQIIFWIVIHTLFDISNISSYIFNATLIV